MPILVERPAPLSRPASTRAGRLFALLEANAIAYCVLGDSGRLPEHVDSDLDLAVEAGRAAEVASLLARFAEAEGGALVQMLQHEPTGWYYVLAGHGANGRPWMLHPDICTDYWRQGRRFLDNATLLGGCRPALDDADRPKGFVEPAPAIDFLYYLIKKIDKRRLEPGQADHLTRRWREDRAGAARLLPDFFAPADVELIRTAAESGNWALAAASFPALRKRLFGRRSLSPAALPRMLGRIAAPTGLTVAVLGPDGSGKSSLLRRLASDLGPAFRRVETVHFRPRLGAGGGDGAGEAPVPHGAPPRGSAASAAKLGYYLADHWLGHAVRLLPARLRSTLVLFDRHLADLLVDPRRYRYGGPALLARIAAQGAPQPDLWLILDVPPEVALRRKQELSWSEVERQRQAYRALAATLPNAHVIDASQQLKSVANAAERIVLDHLARRAARRLRLNP